MSASNTNSLAVLLKVSRTKIFLLLIITEHIPPSTLVEDIAKLHKNPQCRDGKFEVDSEIIEANKVHLPCCNKPILLIGYSGCSL